VSRAGYTFLVALGVASAASAARGPRQPVELPAATAPLHVEVAGCAVVDASGTCELARDRVLRVWVAADDADRAVVLADARSLAARVSPLGRGARLEVVVPPDARWLRVRTTDGSESAPMRVADAPPSPVLDRAQALRQAGDGRGARSLLRDQIEAGALDGRERAVALGIVARIDLAHGDMEDAVAGFRSAIAACREAALTSQAALDSVALAFALAMRQHRFEEATAVLDEAERDGLSDETRVHVANQRGEVARELGQYRSALVELRDAGERAQRLGMARTWAVVEHERALVLQEVGRNAEAARILRALVDASADASGCDRANRLVGLGWVLLLAREAEARGTDAGLGSPSEPLLRAESLFPGSCSDPFVHADTRTNLALDAVGRGDAAGARAWLDRARATLPERGASLELWWLDVEARIALEEAHPLPALALFAEERRRTEAILDSEVVWRATEGTAEALESAGQGARALGEYARAERLLDDASLQVPLGEGRERFLAERERSARGRVGLLVRSGRPAEAMAAARVARARILRALARTTRIEQLAPGEAQRWSRAVGEYRRRREALAAGAQRDWTLPSDALARVTESRRRDDEALRAELDAALSQPAEGRADEPPDLPDSPELTILYHPTREGWVGFAAEGRSVTARRLAPVPGDDAPASLAAWLLAPFAAELHRATGLRVLPYGALRGVDFHGLPLDGEALVARLPVQYALDVPVRDRGSDDERAALVLSDPRLDLAAAPAETEGVARILGRHMSVRFLSGAAVTHAAVVDGIGASRVLHYAGHGAYAGRDGWESSIALAEGQSFGVTDVLMLPRAPALVTLSSCLAGRTAGDASAEGLGMAHAFVLAGARAVIAPTREVDDALAADLSRRFYEHLETLDAAGATEALRAAQDELRRSRPQGDWAAYRIVVP